MNDSRTGPRLEDLASVGTRVSWGAILSGAFLALGIYFLFATIGAAVGLTAADRVSNTTAEYSAVAWAIGTTVVALFVGGLVTSLFTAGENKTEAVCSGIIMWAVLFCIMLFLGAVGVRAGSASMVHLTDNSSANTANTQQSWEVGARAAGVSPEQIEDWRRKSTSNSANAQDDQAKKDAAKRMGWYAFGGTWLAMAAAAAGAFVGAGPTFRLVTVSRSGI